MQYETPIQVSTSACQTVYRVGKHLIELGIITGGTPVLDFTCFGYSKRYPIIDIRWMDCDFSKDGIPKTDNWLDSQGCFKHQDPKNIQGPTFDVLPNGVQSLYEYLDELLPCKALRESRLARFASIELKSKGHRDKEEHTIFRLRADVRYGRIPCVTVTSASYWGRCEDKIALPCVSKTWQDLAAFINPIFDGKIHVAQFNNGHSPFTLDNLTEDQFQTLLALYNKIAND